MDDKTKIITNESVDKNENSGGHTVIRGVDSTDSKSINSEDRKLVGYFTSYSKTLKGESWNIYEGRNLIGKSNECDITLSEATISEKHAMLVVRQNADTKELMFAIADQQSSNGTFLNSRDTAYQTVLCKHGDIVKIGEYHLLLFCIDTIKLGLSKNENFKSLESVSDKYDYSARNPDSTRIIE